MDKFIQHQILAVKRSGRNGLIAYMRQAHGVNRILGSMEIYSILKNIVLEVSCQMDGRKFAALMSEAFDFQLTVNSRNVIDMYEFLSRTISSMLVMLPVRENGKCINGFDEETIREFDLKYSCL